MRRLQILRLRLRSLFRRAQVERELDDELRFHIDLQVRQNLAAGMSPEDARLAAIRQFGHPAQQQDECRDERRTRMIENLFEDVRYAVRGLRRDPILAIVATLTLALSIGATTVVFSIANSILIRPLPYPAAERIDWISELSGPRHEDIGTAPDYYSLREQNRIFEDVAAFNHIPVSWTGAERPEVLEAAAVSASFFRVMGTRPALGRYLAPQEEGSKAPAVAVVSYAFWRNRLGSDPHVLGTTIALDRLPRTIIGVMPQGFDFPRGTQFWLPMLQDESSNRPITPARPIFVVSILARRKPDVTPLQAETEMNRLTFAIREEYPKELRQRGFRTDLVIRNVPLQQHLTGNLRPALLVLTGAVGMVLLIACGNLANLLLARAGSRRRELAVRMALGSSRARMVAQMLTESLVLAIPGGLAGIAIGSILVRLLDALKPGILVRYPAISIDLRVLSFTVALTFAASLLFGMAPALSAAGIRIHEALKSASLLHTGGRGAARVRKLLVVAQLGISLVLLIGAGLLARSFLHLARTELGFRSDHLLTFRVNPIGSFNRDNSGFYNDLLGRLKHLPMSASAALLSDIPLNDEDFIASGRIRVEGRPPLPFVERPVIHNTSVSPEFFHTMEIPLKAGRVFDAHDSVQPRPVVVNQAFVRQIFPGEDPLGRRLGFGPDERNMIWTIVGVVGDLRGGALGAEPPSMVYLCACPGSPVFRSALVVRTTGDPKAAIRAVELQVRALDRDQPVSDVKTMDERRDVALAPERFQLVLIGAFAGIAILLAAAGVYGIMSYLVARRTREIGIRVAMGARSTDVVRIIAGETVRLVVPAVALGLGGAVALTRFVRSMLFGVTPLDAVTFALTPVLLAMVVLAACFAPARRALHVDPVTALREE
jgi:predicted permease